MIEKENSGNEASDEEKSLKIHYTQLDSFHKAISPGKFLSFLYNSEKCESSERLHLYYTYILIFNIFWKISPFLLPIC